MILKAFLLKFLRAKKKKRLKFSKKKKKTRNSK